MPYPPRLALLALLLAAPWAAAQAPETSTRVLREANNPMRMILEAAKIKPRAKPEAARPADKAAPRAAAAASAPAAVAEEGAEPALATAPATPAPPGVPESQVTTVEVDTPAPRPAAEAQAEPADVKVEAPPLQLASMVEPVTPRALRGQLRGDVRTHVAFTVAPDGSVRDAAVRSSTHPRMDAAVLEAVGQWRYQPIAAPRAHEVLVVLRPPE